MGGSIYFSTNLGGGAASLTTLRQDLILLRRPEAVDRRFHHHKTQMVNIEPNVAPGIVPSRKTAQRSLLGSVTKLFEPATYARTTRASSAGILLIGKIALNLLIEDYTAYGYGLSKTNAL